MHIAKESAIALAFIILVFVSSHSSSVYAQDYQLGPGDVINISVYDEPELSVSKVRVARNGLIPFPLIGKVEVVDRSLAQLEKEIENRLLQGYLKHPKVTVSIDSYRVFYVNGQLNKPGAFPYVVGLTIRKAIAIAGGLNDRASQGKIRLKREHSDEEIKVDDLDVEMGPGDVLTIGESLF